MTRWLFGPLAACLTVTALTHAERAPLSPEKLDKESTHVVEGKVLAVYTRDAPSTMYGEGTVLTHYLVEIQVTSCAKGDRIQPQDVIYGRCWKVKRHGIKGIVPGPGGHFVIPNEGDGIRAFLKKGSYLGMSLDNNGLNVLYPNGIETLSDE